MNLELLALLLMLVLWAALGTISWVAGAALRRGRGVLLALPLSALGGLAGGLLVPGLGRRDGVGLLASLVAALLSGLIFAAAGFRLGRHKEAAAPKEPISGGQADSHCQEGLP